MFENDDSLLDAIKKKDIESFEKLFHKHHGRLVQFAMRFTEDLASAQDIVQDAFITIWEKSENINASLSGYLFQSVRNKCINLKHRAKLTNNAKENIKRKLNEFEKYPQYDSSDPYYSFLETELEIKINNAIESLPPKCKRVYKLSRSENLKNKEIASKLNISEKMVEKHISKALKVLRVELSEYISVLILMLLK